MKHNLYLIIALVLGVGFVLTKILEAEINNLPMITGIIIIIFASIVGYGMVLLALWDCNYIGRDNERTPSDKE